ncbi:MAG: DUF3187 family protein [Geobacter sp.]|nr:DUF3187 family protein [Geobacter sp.]
MIKRILVLFLLACSAIKAAAAEQMEITPFRIVNQSPLVQIFGLPGDSAAGIATPGQILFGVTQDLSSNYTASSNARETIQLDGETYRATLYARYGLMPRWEIGAEIPYIIQGGGFLDRFIIDWHSAFGLPQGGRESAPKDHIGYRYKKDGVQKLNMGRSGSGIGDVSLTTGVALYQYRDDNTNDQLALKASLKLPTGDSVYLRGSGGTDFQLQLCGSMTNFSEWGPLGLFGSVGGLVMSDGDILRDQHNNLAGFGTLGLGWAPASWISFKLQLNGNTPLYRDSSLDELSSSSLMLLSGGTLKLPDNYLLDIGVSEDLAVATAPDVGFHLGLSKKF